MAYHTHSKPIFRKPPSRPHQYSVLRRRFRYGVYTAPPEGKSHAFVKRQFRNPEPDVRRRRRTQIPLPAPRPQPPGWMEAIRQRTERYPKLMVREIFDVRKVIRARPTPGVTPPVPSVSAPVFRRPLQQPQERAQRALRQKYISGVPAPPTPVSTTIHRRPSLPLRRRWKRAQRTVFISTKAVVAAGASIGWLVVYMIRRILGHNIRR
jgi:hypothetical protein